MNSRQRKCVHLVQCVYTATRTLLALNCVSVAGMSSNKQQTDVLPVFYEFNFKGLKL